MVKLFIYENMKNYGSLLSEKQLCLFLEPAQPAIQLLRPFSFLIRLTGLDLRHVNEKDNNDVKKSKLLNYASYGVAVIFMAALVFRIVMFFNSTANVLSFGWAESNLFAFLSLHTLFCAIAIIQWTRSHLITRHIQSLENCRTLRLSTHPDIDDYSSFHRKCFILPIFLFIILVTNAVITATHKKYLYDGVECDKIIWTIMPILTFYSCLLTSTTLIVYVSLNVSMWREIKCMNDELKQERENNKLNDNFGNEIMAFSHRQLEILKMVKATNESIGIYGKFGPLFIFFTFVNAIYITSFSELSTSDGLQYYSLISTLVAILAIILFTLLPPIHVQDEIKRTANILMFDDSLHKANDPQFYQTYRIMCERSQHCDTRIYVLNGFPIESRVFNVAMFVIPNLATLLMLVKKTLILNNIKI